MKNNNNKNRKKENKQKNKKTLKVGPIAESNQQPKAY